MSLESRVIEDTPPECPRCGKNSLKAWLAHSPPPGNKDWVLHVFCGAHGCGFSFVIACDDVRDNQVKAFRAMKNALKPAREGEPPCQQD